MISDVRLLIPDNAATPTFDDAQIQQFLDLGGDNPFAAAAIALNTLAADTALSVAWVRDHDLQIDGPKMADAIRAMAKTRYAEADAYDARTFGEYFDIIDVYDCEELSAWPG